MKLWGVPLIKPDACFNQRTGADVSWVGKPGAILAAVGQVPGIAPIPL